MGCSSSNAGKTKENAIRPRNVPDPDQSNKDVSNPSSVAIHTKENSSQNNPISQNSVSVDKKPMSESLNLSQEKSLKLEESKISQKIDRNPQESKKTADDSDGLVRNTTENPKKSEPKVQVIEKKPSISKVNLEEIVENWLASLYESINSKLLSKL